MKFIILGIGRVGETIAKSFIKDNNDVTIIDRDAERVHYIVDKYDVMGICAMALERDVLINSGISMADFFIACSSHDEVNLLACTLAKKLGAKKTIARVRDPKYFKEVGKIRDELGIDFAFNPELRAASDIARILRFPYSSEVESFAGGRVIMASFTVAENSPIVNKTLKEISSISTRKVLFALVKRKDQFYIPRGDFTILAGDEAYLLAPEEEITVFLKKIKAYKQRSKSVLLVGGGKIAYYLAKELVSQKTKVKIIEKDKQRCLLLADLIPSATIINGDGTDEELLLEEGIKDYSACVALTGVDEENTVISLYAMQKGVDKVIAKLERDSVIKMTKGLGVKAVVSPKESVSDHIIRFVRANSLNHKAGINTLHRFGSNVEVSEFLAGEDFLKLNVPLKDLKIKSGILIGGIVRKDEFIHPNGDETISKGDRIILISTKKFNTLAEILK